MKKAIEKLIYELDEGELREYDGNIGDLLDTIWSRLKQILEDCNKNEQKSKEKTR